MPSRRQCWSWPRKSERHLPKLSLTYTTGTPASRARRLSLATARAASRARASICCPPCHSKSLIMSISSSATRQSSGALPCRSPDLPFEGGIQGGRERCISVHQREPRKLLAFAPAFGGELQSLGGKRQHVGLARHEQLALQRPV